ncbi:U-box/RING-like protein [Hyphantria cunea granulovirus]|uniref:U-box/RING-like protein n=1 Tax=Hyphantria cunea granulovirus TaxID=307448 RepID=A0AAF1D2B7_9BBAC|nr:U-box/RING-like protein [Hyphantria cunea granulovirus]QBQ01675.1 U-box/RING-like protein [Hyphantria cunea granulovirus]
MAFLVNVHRPRGTKKEIERVINDQFETLECAICFESINQNNKGFLIITSNKMADLEHLLCSECNSRFIKKDPYKRDILYRLRYPFDTDEEAHFFIENSRQFVLNEGDEAKIEEFRHKIIESATQKCIDTEFNFDLFGN